MVKASNNMKNVDVKNCASIWFLRLERATNLGDTRKVAEARRELQKLGVHVQFEREAPETPAK